VFVAKISADLENASAAVIIVNPSKEAIAKWRASRVLSGVLN